jgi:hypothetical protein
MKALAVGLLVTGIAFALASPAWASETFGIKSFESSIASNPEGTLATQAGSHPYALTTTVMFSHKVIEEEETYKENAKGEEVPLGEPEVFTQIYGNPRNLEVNLPAGLVINPAATAVECTEAQLETRQAAGGGCPAASAVGIVTVYIYGSGEKVKGAVYNMVPPPGVPAELGMDPGAVGLVIHIVGHIRTGSDYGFSANLSEISQKVSIYGLELTLWGAPSEAGHDAQRGICASSGAVQKGIEKELWEIEKLADGTSTEEYRFDCPTERTDTPLLTMPGACTGQPLETTLSVNSWQDPEQIEPAPVTSPPMTGCEALRFNPTLEVTPTPEASSTTPAATQALQAVAAESPTGLNVDLKLPYEESAEEPAEADPRQLTVTLPPGMAISLPAADGLGACTNSPEPERPEGEIALHSTAPVRCPESSELGTAEVATPLLGTPLKGAVYLAQPEVLEGSLIGLYIVVEGSGVQIKLAGKATLDPETGQVTLTLGDLPQLPLSEVRLGLFGGPRAALQTPPACGTYTMTSQLTPWSGTPAVAESSNLEVATGPGGGACPSGKFSPSFTAGTTNARAGAFSPFSLTLSRQGGEQRLGSFAVRLPPGLLAALRNVAPCPEPQASEAHCPQASAIGTTTVGAGPGVEPLYLPATGQPTNTVYLTGPYNGAPFGLSIVVPAIAGPFDLGEVVLRAKIEVDPHTAQLIISSDPLPAILKGVPLDIRTVNMTLDRAGFIFNPTSCAPLAISGTLTSTSGTSAAVAGPFDAMDCAKLPFEPKLTALTHARTSQANGAYLHIKIVSGPSQASIAKLKLDLPKQLSARLTTLQQACAAATFAANPANCPTVSNVGTATVVTPVLSRPLTGPAYLVSHGVEAFPDLEIVLQGEGVELILDGQTSIEKGVTSSAFKALPDVPLSTLDLVLADGPHSLLGANLPAEAHGSFCGKDLAMPVAITGQNGAVVKQSTKIAISGCPRPKPTKRKRPRPKPKPKRVRA